MMPSGPLTSSDAAAGPLVVSATNPRFFTVASGNDTDRKVVYLTGSHIWNNFHDGMGPGAECAETPELFDYDAYLAFLIDTLKQYEQQMGYANHPVGMTMQFPVADQRKVNEVLFNSPA